MTPEQLSDISESFDKACVIAPDFPEKFYRQLTHDYPKIRDLFNANSTESQHTRFISMLGIILSRMKSGSPVQPLLRELGKQHQMRGVTGEHYETFSITFMKVLQDVLGSDFNQTMKDAWATLYLEIAETMKSAGD